MPWNPGLYIAFSQQLPEVPPLSPLLGAPGLVWPVHPRPLHPSNTLHWIPQALHAQLQHVHHDSVGVTILYF